LLPVLKSTSRSVVSEPGFGTKGWSMAQNFCVLVKAKRERTKSQQQQLTFSIMPTMCLSLAVMQKCAKKFQTASKPFSVISLDTPLF
jgi:hypothetical protein